MLLTVDVGNTQTVLGLYEDGDYRSSADAGLVDHWRIRTDHERTSDEHAVLVRNLLRQSGHGLEGAVTGVAICAGVPRVLASLRQMIDRYVDFEAVVIEPGVKTGMPILYDNPREVGADRIANAVGAYDLYGGPTVVVDFGTGNNFDVISADGEFLGGAIAPGIEVSLDALFGRAAALRSVELVEPRSVIGKSTVASLQSGAVYGFAAQVDGMVERFRAELGGCTVVATGGLVDVIAPVSSTIEHVEPFLTLHGLRLVYGLNQ
ncbi:MAG: type III pantothenate kinase [Acidimicrobiales bacterium]|jgi:type III pantothenate kinase|nr:type III pantothenate kinase [Acidimicrobiaceae bacterium]MBT5567734.1 type III pantothenate kinase [Acidimicrobiaceae bacterium]|tara:strand:- start:6 stop:794 length:789 start_codon:yes stop_codon:yes gene_type:complete